MSNALHQLHQKLTASGAESLAFFSAIPLALRSQPIYTDGAQWNVKDILAHIGIAEREFLLLFQNVCAGGAGTPENFDIKTFNETSVAKTYETSYSELLEEFRAARQAIADFVHSLPEEALELQGNHPFLKLTTLGKMLKLVYMHSMVHERDIRQAIYAA